jgi:hypothetical protein
MLIATFGPTTAWVGKQITHEGGTFVLEGHGEITPAAIMEFDRQGHLSWVNSGTRAWVGSKAMSPATSAVPVAQTPPATSLPSRASDATSAADAQPESRRRTYVKRALIFIIALLVVVNTVLLLTLLGVVHVP